MSQLSALATKGRICTNEAPHSKARDSRLLFTAKHPQPAPAPSSLQRRARRKLAARRPPAARPRRPALTCTAARPLHMRHTSPAPAPLPPTTAPALVPWPPGLSGAVSSTQTHACDCPFALRSRARNVARLALAHAQLPDCDVRSAGPEPRVRSVNRDKRGLCPVPVARQASGGRAPVQSPASMLV